MYKDRRTGPSEAPGGEEPNRLHSDLLQEAYGQLSIRLLRHDGELRIAHLVDRLGISRTFAVTFLAPADPELVQVDAEMREGAPMGRTFRRHGYEVRRNILRALTVEVPSWLREEFAHPSFLAYARVSEFLARTGGGTPILYGTVVEIYSPDFRSPELNPAEFGLQQPAWQSLLACSVSAGEAWQRLANPGAGNRDDGRYEGARALCRQEVDLLVGKFISLLQIPAK